MRNALRKNTIIQHRGRNTELQRILCNFRAEEAGRNRKKWAKILYARYLHLNVLVCIKNPELLPPKRIYETKRARNNVPPLKWHGLFFLSSHFVLLVDLIHAQQININWKKYSSSKVWVLGRETGHKEAPKSWAELPHLKGFSHMTRTRCAHSYKAGPSPHSVQFSRSVHSLNTADFSYKGITFYFLK